MRDSDWVSAILQNAIPLIFILFTYLPLQFLLRIAGVTIFETIVVPILAGMLIELFL